MSSLRTPRLALAVLLLAGLAPGVAAQDARVQTATRHLDAQRDALRLTAADVASLTLVDHHVSASSDVAHFYFHQRHDGVPVYNGVVNVSVAADGRVVSAGSRAVTGLDDLAGASAPGISAPAAAEAAARAAGLAPTAPFREIERTRTASGEALVLSEGGVALEPVPARLVYFPLTTDGEAATPAARRLAQRGERVRLAWNVGLYTQDQQHYWDTLVDAATGEVLARYDLVVHDHWGTPVPEPAAALHAEPLADVSAAPTAAASPMMAGSYNVYAHPVESPNHGARSLVASPADLDASPFEWHDTNGAAGAEFTTTQGNNVHAYTDTNFDNLPDVGSSPDGGAGLLFDYALDLTMDPVTYPDAAVTNLFYWNNVIHDVLYGYGFDEASGNFQVNNYGNGGLGNDDVRAEGQDGAALNNANFLTPVDGLRPRMQMFLFNQTTPRRDGDLDNGVILHEYGHGVSNRLTGGPANVNCLSNAEQMGEGWSDFFSLTLTDDNTADRGMGTYVLGQPTTGPGVRPTRYTQNMAENTTTYGVIGGLAIPHGVGYVWATMLWEMTRDLVAAHGFNPDVYDDWTTGGNNLAIQLVIDGLKMQPCSPGFVDGRDAILAADQALTGGANQHIIWTAFARRGLGYSADQGLSTSTTDGTEAFDLPPGAVITVSPLDGPGGVPVPEPVPIGGGQTEVFYAGTIWNTNPGPGSLTIDGWPVITMPDLSVIVRSRPTVYTVPPGGTVDYSGAFNMLAAFAPGAYVFTYNLGDHSAVIDFSDSFQLVKSAPRGSGAEAAAVPDGAQADRSLAAQAVASFGTDEWVAVAPGEDVAAALAGAASAPAAELPSRTALGSAYPNPFNPTATVPFTVAEAGAVRLAVYDVLGREVARLVDGHAEAGAHTAVFDASMLPSGTYLVRFEAAGQAQTQRLTLLK